jgi:hypothetical protein
MLSCESFHRPSSFLCLGVAPAAFKKFYQRVSLVFARPEERRAAGFSLAVVCQYRLTQCGEQAVMEEGRLVSHAPETRGQESAVAAVELGRPRRLILVERFVPRPRGITDVVQAEISVGGHLNDIPIMIQGPQPRLRETWVEEADGASGKRERFPDVFGLKIRESVNNSSTVRPAAIASTIMPTVTLIPRMHGLPPITPGSMVIRRSSCTHSLPQMKHFL